jgi:AcrR family transcriptional regulator
LDKQQILEAATLLAETYGYAGVYKRHIAAHLKCGMGTVNYHWKTMAQLRSSMMRRAMQIGTHDKILRASSPL